MVNVVSLNKLRVLQLEAILSHYKKIGKWSFTE